MMALQAKDWWGFQFIINRTLLLPITKNDALFLSTVLKIWLSGFI